MTRMPILLAAFLAACNEPIDSKDSGETGIPPVAEVSFSHTSLAILSSV